MFLFELSFCVLLSWTTIATAQPTVQCQTSQTCIIRGIHLTDGQPLVLPPVPPVDNAKKLVFWNSTFYTIPKEVFTIAPKVPQISVAGCALQEIGGAFIGSAQLQYFQKLYVGGNDITTLEAGQFDSAIALTDLDLSGNAIDRIAVQAFRSLRKLRDLNLGSNQIATLEPTVFSGLSALVYLYLNDNQIPELKLREWGVTKSLTRLYLGGNILEVLSEGVFEGYRKIQKLDLANNGLKQLDAEVFKPLANLKFINLSGNKLTTLNQLQFGSRLNYLYLNSSGIQTINFDIFSKGVVNVALQFNEIAHIEAQKKNFDTQNLNLAGNALEHFPGNLQFQQLTDLALSDNPKLQWQPKMLWGFGKLKALHLKATNLNASILELGVLSAQQVLVNLDMSFNDLRRLNLTAMAKLPSLADLSISNTNLTELVGHEFIKKTFPDLTFITITGNLWNCSYLDAMISTFYKMSVSLNGQDVVGKGQPHVYNIACNRSNEQVTTTENPIVPTTVPTTVPITVPTTVQSTVEETTMQEMRTYIRVLEEIVPTDEPAERQKEVTTVLVPTEKSKETTAMPASEEYDSGSEETNELPASPFETKVVLPHFERGSHSSAKENDSSGREEELQTGFVVVSMPLIWTVLGILAIVTVVLVILVYVVLCSNIVLAMKKTYVVKEPPSIQMEMMSAEKVDDYNDSY